MAGSHYTKAETDFGAFRRRIRSRSVFVWLRPGRARHSVRADVLNCDRRAEDCAPYLRAHAQLNCERDAIENHKMKTRCFDHIDLRVTNMETAGKFYGKISAAARVCSRKSGRRLLHVLCWRWRTAVGIFLFKRGQEPSSQRHANRVLGGHARRSGSDFETRARRWREKP